MAIRFTALTLPNVSQEISPNGEKSVEEITIT